MTRKAQAAMEFLMTYGWAILVVLVVIGALAYFGVLNPAKLLPDKCTATAGIQCADYTFSAVEGKIKLINGLGTTLNLDALDPAGPLTFSTLGGTTCGAPTPDATSAVAGGAITVTITGGGGANCAFNVGDKVKGSLEVKYYTTDPAFTHTATVEVAATVQ